MVVLLMSDISNAFVNINRRRDGSAAYELKDFSCARLQSFGVTRVAHQPALAGEIPRTAFAIGLGLKVGVDCDASGRKADDLQQRV